MLGDCRSKAAIRKSLATLPQTLDKTYERILCRISEADLRYAMNILQWLAFSFEPLLLDQVAEIAAIDINHEPIFDPDDVLEDPSDILSICPGLITLSIESCCEQRAHVTLAHYSVKEYLLSDRIREGPAALYSMRDSACHDAITQGCLGYLLQFQEPDYASSPCIHKFRLRNYCALYWVRHAERADEETGGYSKLAMELLSEGNPAYLNWLEIAMKFKYHTGMPGDWWVRELWHTPPWDFPPSPLYTASHFDLSKIVRLLIDRGADINEMSGYLGNALIGAVHCRQERITKLLIEKGADVNAYCSLAGGSRIPTPLLRAVRQWEDGDSDKRFVRLLVEHGAEIVPHGSADDDKFREYVNLILQGNSVIGKQPWKGDYGF